LSDSQLRAGEVFVPGGLPTVTYNPRTALRLEERARDYLDERHRILSLSGPTKSGKTVLLRSILRGVDAVWSSGGEVGSVGEFWAFVADQLGIFPDEAFSGHSGRTASTDQRGGLRGTVLGAGADAEIGRGRSDETVRGGSQARSRPTMAAAKEALLSRTPPIVIDDFHYLDRDVQAEIVRSLKDLVFEGVPVVLASVPHRAFDAVRVEREMTGRVEQLTINFWEEDELLGIASNGFAALNLLDEDDLARRLAEESFSSPFLMQDFCLELCKANGFRFAADAPSHLEAPEWESFFRARASSASQTAFDMLARGPRQRRDRIERRLKDGRVTDIYGVVLEGIAYTGPLTKLTYEELRGAIRDIVADPPQRQEVTRVLEEMSKIAREQIEGEPVVDYDAELATLFISDPFFAYYLRWGSHQASFPDQ
jgi:hypothetical protein